MAAVADTALHYKAPTLLFLSCDDASKWFGWQTRKSSIWYFFKFIIWDSLISTSSAHRSRDILDKCFFSTAHFMKRHTNPEFGVGIPGHSKPELRMLISVSSFNKPLVKGPEEQLDCLIILSSIALIMQLNADIACLQVPGDKPIRTDPLDEWQILPSLGNYFCISSWHRSCRHVEWLCGSYTREWQAGLENFTREIYTCLNEVQAFLPVWELQFVDEDNIAWSYTWKLERLGKIH